MQAVGRREADGMRQALLARRQEDGEQKALRGVGRALMAKRASQLGVAACFDPDLESNIRACRPATTP